ncbi:MAG TPA: 2Fe-2S iron-sulfur cluster-binding protein [Myxococcota bacterium]|nr:2Fe-2S iron-sulfur cluster-binding protein [Myxococcota bacterium]
MPKLTIDGNEYEVAAGRTILQAIDDLGLLMNGVDIPHYCWHPKLTIDGSCRLCQVEIEGMPKLQIACNTPVSDGMKVHTQTERVQKARRGVMELLLINHPLDCPICDQAGECKLQDYAFEYGVAGARTREPRRPAKKSVDLGPTILFDQERCILCRRCVRFCREISHTGELGVFNRGDESLLETFPGIPLDNPYSMNVADICPVGALTTKDFRFKIRVWFTDDVESVCNQCARGCNIVASRSNNKIYRFVPRRNDAVNDTWMCDHGRMSYKLNAQGRISSARVDQKPVSSAFAAARAGELVRAARASGGRVVGVASPFSSNEELEAFRDFLAELGAGAARFAVPHGDSDEILIEAEKAPNAAGCRALGMQESSDSLGHAELAIVLGHTTHAAAFADVRRVILVDSHESALSARADVVLPARTFLEESGHFTNVDGVVQRFNPVVEPNFEALSEREALDEIRKAAAAPPASET